MDPDRHQRLSDLFSRACDLSDGERARFLDEECGGDEALRAEVEALLLQDRRAEDGDATEELAPDMDTELRTADERDVRVGGSRKVENVPGYRLIRELGSGGAGTVFEAVQEGIGRRVALKVLAEQLVFSERAGKRFEREAWITGQLTHPNIVRVYERGMAGNVPFFSMEYVEGGSLHDVQSRMREQGVDERTGLRFDTRPYMDWVLELFQQVARALHFTHERGIVHRDIKPMNLLLDVESATLKLADFGIAVEENVSRLTSEGQILGTLRYMAPEQLRGDLDAIGPRSDVYALGVSLYEMLSLTSPFPDESREGFLHAVISGDARPLDYKTHGAHRDLAIVVAKAIERDPRDRYDSAAAFADDLQRIVEHRPILARRPSIAGRLSRWARRKPAHAALVLTLLIAGPVTTWVVYQNQQKTAELEADRLDDLHLELRRIRGGTVAMRETAEQILELRADDPQGLRAMAVSYFNESRATSGAERAAAIANCKEASERWIARLPDVAEPLRTYAYILDAWAEGEAASGLRERADRFPRTVHDDYTDIRLRIDAGGLDRAELESILVALNDVLDREEGIAANEDRHWVHSQLGNWDEAIADLRVLRAMDPTDPWPLRKIGKLLTRKGDYASSLDYFERARALGESSPSLWLELSNNALQWGRSLMAPDPAAAEARFVEAAGFAEEGLALAPESPKLHLNLGASLVDRYRVAREPDTQLLSESNEAFAAGRRIAQQESLEDLESLSVIAQCDVLVLAGRSEEALSACERSVELNAESADAHYNLAGAYALAGRVEDALDELALDHQLGDNDHIYLAGDAWFDSLREHPRFIEILESMKREAQ